MSEVVTHTATGVVAPAVGEDAWAGKAVSLPDERGMVSAEWAVGLIAAIAIAGVLLAVVTNGAVTEALLRFILAVIHAFSGKF